MKKIYPYVLLPGLLLGACSRRGPSGPEPMASPRVPVEVVPVGSGSVGEELTLLGSTVYLKRNVVTAPVSAYLQQVSVALGDHVQPGKLLYRLQTREGRLLESSGLLVDSTLTRPGIVDLTASASGIVTAMDRQQAGDYVLEGTPLCTITENDDLYIRVQVPYELTRYTSPGTPCTITLPDGTTFPARFQRALAPVETTAQTQSVLAKGNAPRPLPENLIVRVAVRIHRQVAPQLLPRSCVLSDELLQHFWVMQLIDDSTAVKVPVSIGNRNEQYVEIITPRFLPTDRIVRNGAYALPDTARVTLVTASAP